MGKFGCHCGYVISDSISPCPNAGELRWQTEIDLASDEIYATTKEFLKSVDEGTDKDWVNNYFGDIYPKDFSLSEVIDDIYSVVFGRKGRSVYQCPKCERLYLQKEFYTNEWTCFEKKKN